MRRPSAVARSLGALALVADLTSLSGVAYGHPVDQYLQASYITLERGRVTIEVALTPGLLVKDQVLGLIDVDGDGRVSEAEEQAYPRAVQRDLALEIDGQPRALTLQRASVQIAAVSGAGGDAIRLELTADAPEGGGAHRLVYRNSHGPGVSAYQVNAFLPKDRKIAIERQARDPEQHGIELDYAVDEAATAQADVAPWRTRSSWGLQALLLLGALAFWARPLRESARRAHARAGARQRGGS